MLYTHSEQGPIRKCHELCLLSHYEPMQDRLVDQREIVIGDSLNYDPEFLYDNLSRHDQ